MKTVLLIGSGGREHALAWKLSQSPKLKKLIIVPGNDGMSSDWERWNLPLTSTEDFRALGERALRAKVDLVVVGPDNPLADGIIDVLEGSGLLCFGPKKAAAQIEASKAFAKDVMMKAGVPTAHYQVFDSTTDASDFVRTVEWGSGWVLKADGLALGKGVYVCFTREEALKALESLKALGASAQRLVIEERLEGQEISWFAFSDGERCALFEPARDHKRLNDQDQGPNTGGMGAFSPVPGVPAGFAERVRREVFLPTLQEMKKRGTPFKGLLYAGLMVDFAQEKFWVLEFNGRFGDPETQVLMSRMKDDLLEWCEASALGNLPSRDVSFYGDASVVVVASARGYPEKPEKGAPIQGRLSAPGFFCAGVLKTSDGKLAVNGGRVFGAMGSGKTLIDARLEAYERLQGIRFDGMHFRKDIGGAR